MSQAISPRVLTPCIGVCSTGIGDDVCRGCKRYAHEVVNWNSYDETAKRAIDQRLDTLLERVVSNKLTVVEPRLLEWQLQTQKVRYQAHKSPYVWVLSLLRAGATQIKEPAKFGLQLDAAWQGRSLLELREAIDNEFYILSQAHYERYLVANRRRSK